MIRLWIAGDRVLREDRRSADAARGSLLILPGGEVGVLRGGILRSSLMGQRPARERGAAKEQR